jgi:hypothetical protein
MMATTPSRRRRAFLATLAVSAALAIPGTTMAAAATNAPAKAADPLALVTGLLGGVTGQSSSTPAGGNLLGGGGHESGDLLGGLLGGKGGGGDLLGGLLGGKGGGGDLLGGLLGGKGGLLGNGLSLG